jgi:hypothetical protein
MGIISNGITIIDNGAIGSDKVDTVQIAASAVETAKIADAQITLAKLTATGTKDATTFLRGDNTFSVPPLGGITEADQWRITADRVGVGFITANWERNDTQFSYIGSGMTQSSGIFTFPSTGIYLVIGSITGSISGASRYINLGVYGTSDNSTYVTLAMAYSHSYTTDVFFSMQPKTILDVTDTANVKVKLGIVQNQAGAPTLSGSTTQNRTYITFIRLGDT